MYYPDLPEELRAFWAVETSPLPNNVRSAIAQGWGRMAAPERQALLQKLQAEADSFERVMIASKAAVEATFKPAGGTTPPAARSQATPTPIRMMGKPAPGGVPMPRRDPGEPYYRVNSKEAHQLLQKEPAGIVVVDVRRDDEWVAGHVKGAVHIPIDDLADHLDGLPQDKKLFFICAAGVRSGLACEIAASLGVDSERLYNIEDGTPAWIAAKNPTSYGKNP